jgi:antitoxin component YwqK of YwqJK toxin-antitoxin module
MKNWSKQQKREHEVMLKWDKFHKANLPTKEMDGVLDSYFKNKNLVSEYEFRLKNINGYLANSVEKISELMEEVA